MADKEAALLNKNEEGITEWTAEIKEAVEARKQAEDHLKQNPRPQPPRGLMQRRTSSTHGKARSTTHIMQIDYHRQE